MAKELKAAARLGGSQKTLPTRKKVDYYGCIILILSIFVIQMMLALMSSRTTLIRLTVPHDMLLQGPITVNLTEPDLTIKPLQCNPYYKKFREEYLSEEIKKFETVRSEEFLALNDVGTLVNETTRIQGVPAITFAVSVSGVCEMVPPSFQMGSCMQYEEIESNCLGTEGCGTDPNVCFWAKRGGLKIMALGQFIMYIPAVLEAFALLFDPPPARLHYVVHPLYCAVLFLISGVMSLLGLMNLMGGLKQYAPPLMAQSFAGFSAITDAGYTAFQYCGFLSIIFSVCYFYLIFFSPKYPRQKNRWEVRRERFEKQLDEIRSEMEA